jgi:hypothetical protein
MTARDKRKCWLAVVAFAVLAGLSVPGKMLADRKAFLQQRVRSGMDNCITKFEDDGIARADAVRMTDIMEAVDRTDMMSVSDLAWTLDFLRKLPPDAQLPVDISHSVLRTISDAHLSMSERLDLFPTCVSRMHSADALARVDGMMLAWKVHDARSLAMLRQAASQDPDRSVQSTARLYLRIWGRTHQLALENLNNYGLSPMALWKIKLDRFFAGRPVNSDFIGNFSW